MSEEMFFFELSTPIWWNFPDTVNSVFYLVYFLGFFKTEKYAQVNDFIYVLNYDCDHSVYKEI